MREDVVPRVLCGCMWLLDGINEGHWNMCVWERDSVSGFRAIFMNDGSLTLSLSLSFSSLHNGSKGIVHLKMKIISSFTDPHVVSKLIINNKKNLHYIPGLLKSYKSFVWQIALRFYSLKVYGRSFFQLVSWSGLQNVSKWFVHKDKIIISTEGRKSYRCEMTYGLVNVIF